MNKYVLRDYQKKAKSWTYKAINEGHKYVINWITTGGGKGLLMPDYAMDALNKDKKVLVVMRRRDLIFQTRDNFKKYRNINASIIMGNERGYDPKNPRDTRDRFVIDAFTKAVIDKDFEILFEKDWDEDITTDFLRAAKAETKDDVPSRTA